MVLSSYPWPSSFSSAFYSSTVLSLTHHRFFHIKATLVSVSIQAPSSPDPLLSPDHTCAVLVDPYNGKVHQTGAVITLYTWTLLTRGACRALLRGPRPLHVRHGPPDRGGGGEGVSGHRPMVRQRAVLQEERSVHTVLGYFCLVFVCSRKGRKIMIFWKNISPTMLRREERSVDV